MSDNINNTNPPSEPLTREEEYLSAIAGVTSSDDIPEKPLTRVEKYLNKIVEDGGGSVYDKLEAGTNINIEETSDGKAKISATGEVSSEDTYAREQIANHIADKDNPHEVSAADVGLGNCDNTSDLNKPISMATQTALNLKADKTELPEVPITIVKVNNEPLVPASGAVNITVPTQASDVHALADSVKYAGASTAGGSATSAAKLDTASAGSATQPVYFANGIPTATSYSLEKSVPSNAVFTDTTYESKAAASGGTDVSLCTTGEKYTWNSKQNAIDSSHKLSADLVDDTSTTNKFNVQADWNQTTDTASDYIKNKPTIPTTAADVGAIPTSAKGTASGVAELDSNGKVPSSQLPSYVDDVIEGYYYNSKFYEDSAHTTEITGTTGKIYVDLSTNKTYRWSGSGYTEISESLALGTTSSTAFRGDYGNTAYTHATDSSRSTTAKSSGLYKIASTAQGHIASLTSVQKSDITALGIPAQDTTYTFNTAYNASTNKAATMADIEKGLLPSYAKKTGDVATTDKVVEAIGKLETKADTNKTNISSLYDSGAKNIWSGAASGTVSGWRTAFSGSIPKGNYIVSFTSLTSTDTDADTCQIAAVSGSTVVSNIAQCARGNNVSAAITLTSDADTLWIYSSNSSTSGDGDTATFTGLMICTPAAYVASSTYVPYSPTNAELYALIKSYHS